MTVLSSLLSHGAIAARTPWPRAVADEEMWSRAGDLLASGALTLVSLWGDDGFVHLALLDEAAEAAGMLSFPCTDGHFPSVAARHPPAQRLERTISDLFGYAADGARDPRPWLDHGKWDLRQPLSPASPRGKSQQSYVFLPAEGEALHQIPVGPVHAGIIEPGHFRFTANGETVVRLEEQLGYVHRGIDKLMANAPIEKGARLAARTSGDSTVAYSIAYARAVEAALDVHVSPRAQWLRAAMLELERIANHFGDVGAICNDASFALMHTHCGVLRERALRAADAAFGHRLMMDRMRPGGATDLTDAGRRKLGAFVRHARKRLPAIIELYDETASLQDRTVGAGTVGLALARQFGAGGYVGRASGRSFDARRTFPFGPYETAKFDVPVLEGGDVDARVRLRLAEIAQSLVLLAYLIDNMPSGATETEYRLTGGEGVGIVEGFRGDIFVWVRLNADGTIARCHLRDPSWFQWPLLEAAIDGNIVADFPLCNKSFNCSYAGHDL